MRLSSDQLIFWRHGFFELNETVVTTWVIMLVLAGGCALITRKLVAVGPVSRWQSLLEIVVTTAVSQIKEIGLQTPEQFLGFIGTIFLYVAFASLCTILPGYDPPTGSLSTTTALALCVFIAVPIYGIQAEGFGKFIKTFVQPTPIMLPFNIISQLSRTLALAIRLFGNMMSGAMIVAILLTITPFFFPIVMTALGLLIGMVQAYIFSVLAAVYIAAATEVGSTQSTQKAQNNG